jgi:long-chain acyl-CoA synthetase
VSNTIDRFWHHATEHPGAPALRIDGRSYSYQDVRDTVSSVSSQLVDRGVAPGDRVVIILPTVPEFVFAYYAVLSLGAVVVTVNPASTTPELDHFLRDSGARLALVWRDDAGPATQAAEHQGATVWEIADRDLELLPRAGTSTPPTPVSDRDPAVVLYTSGTTGRPKGAVLTHGNLTSAIGMFAQLLRSGPDDRLGTALPLFHVFGQVGVLGVAHHNRSCLSLLRPFSGRGLLDMISSDQLTITCGVPTMWNELLAAARESDMHGSTVRAATSGGAPLPPEVITEFGDRFGARLLEGYGLSESTSAVTLTTLEDAIRPGSVGRPLPGIEVRIVGSAGDPVVDGTIGEIVFRGPTLMSGYWNDPGATADAVRDGWFHTGDLGRLDSDGVLWIVDRKKDLVIRGGYNVYPREIEDALYEHPRVREAAVVGIPDLRLGEEVAAVISVTPGPSIDLQELRDWLGLKLSQYKVPRLYAVVDELPKGATGKILKRAINRGELERTADRVKASQRTTPAT